MRSNKIMRLKKEFEFLDMKKYFCPSVHHRSSFPGCKKGEGLLLAEFTVWNFATILPRQEESSSSQHEKWLVYFCFIVFGHLWEVAFSVAKIPTIWILMEEILFFVRQNSNIWKVYKYFTENTSNLESDWLCSFKLCIGMYFRLHRPRNVFWILIICKLLAYTQGILQNLKVVPLFKR